MCSVPAQASFPDACAVFLQRQVFPMHVQFPCTGIAQLSMQASQYCRQSFPTSPRSAQDISAQPSITFSHSRHLHRKLCRHPTISSSRFMITPLTCEVNALAWQYCSLEETQRPTNRGDVAAASGTRRCGHVFPVRALELLNTDKN